MASENGIEVEGRVVETLGKALFRVELANQHRLLGHVSSRQRELAEEILMGDKVRVRVSHFDLSKGRIIRKEN